MTRKTKKLNDYDEYDEYDEENEGEYDDEEYDGEYDDEDYDDEYDDSRSRRNPLKGVVIALVILALLMGAIIGLLYMRLQSAEKRNEELTGSLNAARNEVNTLLQERTATPEPVIATPEPVSTPEPTATPEPIVTPAPTPEPTPEPTATPEPLLKDAITDAMLNGVARPDEASWLEKPQPAEVIPFMYALHWGPGMGWTENMALRQGDKVEIVARQNGWVLLRIGGDKFGWGAGTLVTETAG